MSARGGTVTARHLGADRLELAVRGHTLRSDQPLDGGGEDTAPTPTELFVGSLAGCVAFYAERFLRRHGLEDGLVVTAGYRWADGPSRIGAIDVRVDAPHLPRKLRESFRRVIEGCPVHNTLVGGPEIAFEVVSRASVAA